MLYINKIKSFRIYKNKIISPPIIDNDKRKNNLVILFSSNKEESIDLINSQTFSTKFFNCYYIDRKINLNVTNVQKKVLNQNIEYKEIKTNCKNIKKCFPKLDSYNNYNLFYDFHPYLEMFFSNVKYNALKKLELLFNLIEGKLNDPILKAYKNKYILIPQNEYDKNLRKSLKDRTEVSSIIQALFLYAFLYEENFKEKFSDYTFILLNEKNHILFKFKGSEINKKTINRTALFINTINKFIGNEELTDTEKEIINEKEISDTQIEKETESEPSKPAVVKKEEKITEKIKKDLNNNNEENLTEKELDLNNKIEEKVKEKIEKNPSANSDDMMNLLNNDKEFVNTINELANEKLTANQNNASNKRDEYLKKQSLQIKLNNTTVEDTVKNFKDNKIEVDEIKIPLRNPNMKTSTLADFEKSYNKNQLDKDILAVLNSFSENKEIPLYLKSLTKEDSSDEFNKKETYHIVFEDGNRVRHNITLDVPKFLDDKFLYLNGSKKDISKQLTLIPIVKTNKDEVQCVSFYNKAFIMRFGQKFSPKIERLKKFLSTSNDNKIKIITGNSIDINKDYLTNIDYDELAKSYLYIIFDKYQFYFNQLEFRKLLDERKIKYDNLKENELPVGLVQDKLIILDTIKGTIKGTDFDLTDYIFDCFIEYDSNNRNVLNNISVGKKYIYSRISVLSKKLPLILLLGYGFGLSTVLAHAKIKYQFSDTRKKLDLDEKNKLGLIEFKDGYLYYDRYPIKNSLLLNAFYQIPTKNFEYKDFDVKFTYLEFFYNLFNSRKIANGFDNFLELFIDPITKSVLQQLGYPDNVLDLLLYANSLLEDNSYTLENNMSLYRIRSNEIVPLLLYDLIASEYSRYKNTSATTRKPVPISLQKNALTKKLLLNVLVEDYSIINPIKEAEASGSITYKGPSGLNLQDAYTLDKRSYDESMLGILGASSPYNNKAGVSRQLAYNPNILSNRGYIKAGKKENSDLNAANLLTPAELLTPYVGSHDDAPRVA